MKEPSWRNTIYTILLALLLGGTSGVLATAWTSSYLADYAWKVNQLTTPLDFIQERPRNFPSSYKEAVERLRESSLPSVAEFYEGASGPFGYQQGANAMGVVLTTNGWIALSAEDVEIKKGTAVFVLSQRYVVDEVMRDEMTNSFFVKVNGNGLSVASIAKGRDTRAGEQVFVARSASAFEGSSIERHVWPTGILLSSETPNRSLVLTDMFSTGDVVFNLNGEAIGFLKKDGTVRPFEDVLMAFRSILEQKKIVRPLLGVQYVDLAHSIGVSESLSRSHRFGALLAGGNAVQKASPAKVVGLKSGDILLSINGESINQSQGLDELIAKYKPGDVVQILFDRFGEQKTVSVTLVEK